MAYTKFQWKEKKLERQNKFAKLQLAQLRVKRNHLSWSFYVLSLRHCLSDKLWWTLKWHDELLKTTPTKSIKSKSLKSLEPTQLCFALFGSNICFDFSVCHYFACSQITMRYCKHRIDLLLVSDIGALQLIIFRVEGLHAGRFRLSLACCRSLSGHFFLTVGLFILFLVHSRLFQVYSCLF